MQSISKESDVILALQALKRDPRLRIRKVAKIYNVSEATLRNRKKGIRSRREIILNSRKITELEEVTLIQYITNLGIRRFPPRLCDIGDFINIILAQRNRRYINPQ